MRLTADEIVSLAEDAERRSDLCGIVVPQSREYNITDPGRIHCPNLRDEVFIFMYCLVQKFYLFRSLSILCLLTTQQMEVWQ